MHKHVHKRRKITRAASWQQKGDVVRRIADEHKRAIAGAIRDAIAHFRRSIDLDEFKRQLKTGSQLGARGAFPRKKYEDALRKAFERMAQCYEDAAKAGAGQIHNLTLHSRRRRVRKADDPGHGGVYAFDRFTPAVQEALRVLQETFITTMSQDVADTVEQAVYDGMVNGWSADEIASEIRDSIGLNARQAQAIDNYRSGLEAAGTYAPEEIDALVEARAETALDYRADMIARTESIRAANLGLHDGYQQAIERGVFPQEAVRREWQIALDERTCFPAGTMISTPSGETEISKLRAGDRVVTRKGERELRATLRRSSAKPLVLLKGAGFDVAMTCDHPIFCGGRWVAAKDIEPGDLLYGLGEHFEKPVSSVVHLHIRNADSLPAVPSESRVAARILRGIMPKLAIDLDCDFAADKCEVDSVASDLVFLLEWHAMPGQSGADCGFWKCFAVEPTVAAERAELAIACGRLAEALHAGFARNFYGRAAAALRAMLPATFGILQKYLATACALGAYRRSQTAFAGANVVAVSVAGGHEKRPETATAGFFDLVAELGVVATARAETPSHFGLRRRSIECGPARGTRQSGSDFFANVVASHRHNVDVFDIEVDGEHEFFADGILVHNCEICIAIPDQNEGGVEVGEPFETDDGPIMDPPVHPNCRCSVTYVTNLDMVAQEDGEDAAAQQEETA